MTDEPRKPPMFLGIDYASGHDRTCYMQGELIDGRMVFSFFKPYLIVDNTKQETTQ